MLTTDTQRINGQSSVQIDPAVLETMEPVLQVQDIQGNSLGGFHKDYQMLVFLKMDNVAVAKRWIAQVEPLIATAAEVIQFNRLFKEMKQRYGYEGMVKATFMNIGFTFDGLKKLTPDADQFTDESFKAGLHNRAASLGDPVDPSAPGHPSNWLIGGPNNVPDVVLIIASDDRKELDARVKAVVASLPEGLTLMFKQRGESLPGELAGHEHFGFKDGVSQPGIRGRVSTAANDFLTEREDPIHNPNQGRKGQDLLHPGEFIFGYATQVGEPDPNQDGLNINPGEKASAGPAWADNGSYLVFRRLRQDVKGFHAFLKATAAKLSAENPAFAGISADKVGAKIVGRWKSGAPILNSPDQDNPELANSVDFEFEEADAKGVVCPLAAHIRKTYPRDTERLIGGQPLINESATQKRRLLRRGIPYGKPVSTGCPMRLLRNPMELLRRAVNGLLAKVEDQDRGLLFLAYQTSIEGQFEFVSSVWVNNANFPPADEQHPSDDVAGHDAILGQSEDPNTRNREMVFQAENPAQNAKIPLMTDWVIPTGGAYLFTPSISALKMLSR
jgi:Dyp-type peroxidase family